MELSLFGENSGNSLESVSEWFWSQFAQRIDGQTFYNVSPALAGMETTALKASRKAKAEPPKPTAIVPKITYHGFCGTCATRSTEVASSR